MTRPLQEGNGRKSVGVRMIALAFALFTAQPAAPAPAPAPPPTSSRFENVATPQEDQPLGSRVARRTDHITAREQDAAWTMHRFAECLVRTRQRQMLELLATRLNSPEQQRIVRDVIGWRSRCLRARSMQIDNVLLRGAIAEALYRQELRGKEVARLERAPEMLAADPARDSSAALERFGRCMMTRKPELVRALIGTRPGSDEERAALAGIATALPLCLPPSPERARHPLRLRGAVAEAFYLHRHGLIGTQAGAGQAAEDAQPPAPAPAGATQ